MNSRRVKTSAQKSLILEGLDSSVVSKAQSISAVISDFEQKVYKEPLTFNVGKYEVTVDAKGDSSSPDIFLSCTCSYWRYQGCEFHALKNDYLFGTPRGSAEEPTKRDPQGNHKVCKHVYAVLRDFF